MVNWAGNQCDNHGGNEMIFNILLSVVGILFIFFVPGYLLSLIIFKEVEIFERIATSIIFSMAITVIIGLLFGASRYNKLFTGGLTIVNIYVGLILISIILFFVYNKINKSEYNL